jgi:hypothetical protein
MKRGYICWRASLLVSWLAVNARTTRQASSYHGHTALPPQLPTEVNRHQARVLVLSYETPHDLCSNDDNQTHYTNHTRVDASAFVLQALYSTIDTVLYCRNLLLL